MFFEIHRNVRENDGWTDTAVDSFENQRGRKLASDSPKVDNKVAAGLSVSSI